MSSLIEQYILDADWHQLSAQTSRDVAAPSVEMARRVTFNLAPRVWSPAARRGAVFRVMSSKSSALIDADKPP